MAANPYLQGWREWDERYADLVIGKPVSPLRED